MTRTRLFLLPVCAAVLASCGIVKFGNKDSGNKKVVERGTVSVKVVPSYGKNVPVRVSAFAPKDGKRGPELETYLVKDDLPVGFVLPADQLYEFRAFADINRNGKQDPDEPAGILEGVKPDPNVNAVSAPVTLTLAVPPPGSKAAVAPDDADKKKGPAVPGTPAAKGAPAPPAPGNKSGAPVPPPPPPPKS